MKRIIALILIVAMCLVTLTSCIELEALGILGLVALWAKSEKTIVARDVFFENELIVECRLTDMPVPNLEGSALTNNTLYLNMTDEEFITYSKAVLNYLLEKEDAYFKGYQVEQGFAGGIFYLPEYRYAPLTEEYEVGDANRFIFSLTELLNEGDEYNNHYWNHVIIDIVRSEGTLDDGEFSYNASLTIKINPGSRVYYEDYRDPYEDYEDTEDSEEDFSKQ